MAGISSAIRISETPVVTPTTPAGAQQTAVHIFAGTGAPSDADGANGDFYFRGDGTAGADTIIYHKETGSWVACVTH